MHGRHLQDPAFVGPQTPADGFGDGRPGRRRPPSGGSSFGVWLLLVLLLVAGGAAGLFWVWPLRNDLAVARDALVAAQRDVITLQQQVATLAAAKRESDEARAILAAELDTHQQSLEALQRSEEALVGRLATEIESGDVTVYRDAGALVIGLAERALFAPLETTLQPRGHQLIERLAPALAGFAGKTIDVCGFADASNPHGAHLQSAWEFATARAVSVVRLLQGAGQVAAERFRVSGRYGASSSPRGAAGNASGRIELTLLSTPQATNPSGGGTASAPPPPPIQ